MRSDPFVRWGVAGNGGNHRGHPPLHLIRTNLDTTLCGLSWESTVDDPGHQRRCLRCLKTYYILEEQTRELVRTP